MKSILKFRVAASVALSLFFCADTSAQKNFFTPAHDLDNNFRGKQVLNNFSLSRLDENSFRAYVSNAPLEFKKSTKQVLLEIPLPNGITEVFDVQESPILSDKVAAEHPEIKTYTGKGQEHSNYVIRMSFTSSGFNAIVVGMEGNEVYIEKDENSSAKDAYVTYFGSDAKRSDNSKNAFNKCGAGSLSKYNPIIPTGPLGARTTATGGTLRTFKLAVAATAEFTANKGGTQAAAFNTVVGFVNRLVAVYRSELSISFTLVSGTNLVYTTPGTPYTNSNQTVMLDQNQANTNTVIGNANYDVGHVLSYEGGSGGGLALSPSVCISTDKAQGVSGVGDGSFAAVFDDQLFTHEIGHQFGMSHSYNSSIPVCTTREPSTSVEPGAGTTIMSYGFTCSSGSGNDDYEAPYQPILNFHTVNYKQAADYVATLSCFSSTVTGNIVPVIVTNTTDKTIPKSTPFSLTGTATDANTSNVLSYSWEGTNIGTVVPGTTTLANTARPPFFRSYSPVASSTRTFPRLSAILDGSNYAKGDKLPSIAIVTTHRFTVRDNQDGVTYNEMSVTIDANSGPFLETTNLAGTYASGSTQTITWDVANTTAAPVSAPNVDILLSTDGGLTFPTTLVTATPNDGSQSVTLPFLATTTTSARIKVQASNNIFFDISNSNFTINSGSNPLPLYLVSIQANKQGNNITVSWNTVSEVDLLKYDVEYSADGTRFASIGFVNARNSAAANTYNFLHTKPGAGINYYRLKIVSNNGTIKYSQIVSVKNNSNAVNVTVYPNPVKNGYLGLLFDNLGAETFTIKLYTIVGQRLMEKIINHPGGSSNVKIELNTATIKPGTYQLIVSGTKGSEYKQKLVVQ